MRRGLYLDVGLHLVALLVGGAHLLDAEVRGGPGGEHLVPMCLSALGSSAKMPDSAGPVSRSWTGLRAYRGLLRPRGRTVGDEWRCLRRLLWLEVPSRLPQDHSPTELFPRGYETNVSHFSPVLPLERKRKKVACPSGKGAENRSRATSLWEARIASQAWRPSRTPFSRISMTLAMRTMSRMSP